MNNMEITFLDAIATGDSSSAIERSERREQQETVRSQRLPIKTNDHSVPRDIRIIGITEDMEYKRQFEIEKENNIKWTKNQYAKMGIKVTAQYDDLFFNVQIPEGWKIEATDHSMWNNVFDNKNRKRISFFYKGAFYDRDAFANFEKRYSYSEMPFDDYKTDATYEERKANKFYGVVYDCENEIFRTEGIINKDYFDDSLRTQCIDYLKQNFSLWEDINAYWE